VSDDFSGTRISYGYKLWLIAWMLLTDWTSRLEYCLQSPNGNARVDELDFLVELDSWKSKTKTTTHSTPKKVL